MAWYWSRPRSRDQPNYPIHCLWTAKELLGCPPYGKFACSWRWRCVCCCLLVRLGFLPPWSLFQAQWVIAFRKWAYTDVHPSLSVATSTTYPYMYALWKRFASALLDILMIASSKAAFRPDLTNINPRWMAFWPSFATRVSFLSIRVSIVKLYRVYSLLPSSLLVRGEFLRLLRRS